MRDGNVVMLAFGTLLGQICSEGGIPVTDELLGVEECIAEISGTALLHVRIDISQLTGLVSGG